MIIRQTRSKDSWNLTGMNKFPMCTLSEQGEMIRHPASLLKLPSFLPNKERKCGTIHIWRHDYT
jgi:hypothetical protein